MNWQHLQAFVWLRWRLLANQMRKAGTVNAVVTVIFAVFALLFAVVLFVSFFLVGLFALGDPSANEAIPYVWDGLVVAFVFSWTLGVLVELQRSEVLSLEKFLHLPVSLKGVFLINYVSSLFSLTAVVFVPAMLALSLALAIRKGPALLLMFPLLAAFFLMVTAVTYQFQGWLASIMINPRRRRTVIVMVTMGFVLLCQAPNLVNILRPWDDHHKVLDQEKREKLAELDQDFAAGKFDAKELQDRHAHVVNEYAEKTQADEMHFAVTIRQTVAFLNYALPPGWVAVGAGGCVDGELWWPLLGTLGLTSIGSFSLWRSYVTTMRLYTGQFTSGKAVAAPVAVPARTAAAPARNLLERRIPYLSEQASAVALGGFQSLLRAPEAKMLLLTPIILVVVLGSVVMSQGGRFPEVLRPFPAFGAMSLILLTMGQLVGNQFGFDRAGFRVFVLSAAPRRDILLGKNLACAPLALGFGVLFSVVLEALPATRMRFDQFLAFFPQMVSMYLLFCLLANVLSIYAPMPMRAGTMKPMSPRLGPVLLHLLFSLLYPLVFAPTLLPLGVGLAFEYGTGITVIPITLMLSVLVCGVVVFVYRRVLTIQGRLLQSRELRILELVTPKGD